MELVRQGHPFPGMTVTSLLLPSTRSCPSTSPNCGAHALSMCAAGLENRTRSCHQWLASPEAPSTSTTRRLNMDSKQVGSRARNTRRKQSCEGIPLRRTRKRRNHDSLSRPRCVHHVQKTRVAANLMRPVSAAVSS